MNKQKIKIRVSIALLVVTFFVLAFSAHAQISKLECNITEGTTCESGWTRILALEDWNNSHVEIPTLDNYSYSICCRDMDGTVDIGTTCDALDVDSEVLLKLNGTTNTHVEQNNFNNYHIDACISEDELYYYLECGYGFNNCNGYDTCLASISTPRNAHVATCDFYNITVCCSLKEGIGEQPLPIPEFTTIGILFILTTVIISYFVMKNKGML